MSKSSNPAVSAKVRAMYGKRIKQADYNDLLSCRSLESVTLLLKGHPSFSAILSEVDASHVHREYLETVIRKEYFRDVLKLFHYLDRKDRQFLDVIILHYEIEEILWCINRIHDNGVPDIGFLDFRYEYFEKYSKLDFSRLGAAKKTETLLEALENTPFENVLQPIYRKEGDLSYSAAEHSLWAYYYQTFYAHLKKFYGQKKAPQIEKSIGIQVDMLNIMLIYRLRQKFHLPPQAVRPYLFEQRYKMSDSMLEALLNAETQEDFQTALYAASYRTLANSSNLQQSISAFIDHNAHKVIHFSNEPIALILAFLTLKNTELKNIKTIVEGCRYHVPREQIEPLLINYQKVGEAKTWQ